MTIPRREDTVFRRKKTTRGQKIDSPGDSGRRRDPPKTRQNRGKRTFLPRIAHPAHTERSPGRFRSVPERVRPGSAEDRRGGATRQNGTATRRRGETGDARRSEAEPRDDNELKAATGVFSKIFRIFEGKTTNP